MSSGPLRPVVRSEPKKLRADATRRACSDATSFLKIRGAYRDGPAHDACLTLALLPIREFLRTSVGVLMQGSLQFQAHCSLLDRQRGLLKRSLF